MVWVVAMVWEIIYGGIKSNCLINNNIYSTEKNDVISLANKSDWGFAESIDKN